MNWADALRRAAAGQPVAESERGALAQGLLADADQTRLFGVTAANVAEVVDGRLARLAPARAALRAEPLDVAGLPEHVACSPRDLFRFHLPLADLIARRAAAAESRCLVAIAAVPAGGKSVFAAILARILASFQLPFGVASVGLDGYHYPNAYLGAHAAPPGVAPPGRPLSLYKGASFTFDVARFAADLRRIRRERCPVSLPAYDRRVHDTVEEQVVVAPDDRLVLVEGNFLLHRRDGWEALTEVFDLSIFLDMPPGANRKPLIERHMRGGRSFAQAVEHFDLVDGPNTATIAATRREADIVVELDAAHAVRAIAASSGHA